MSGADNSGAEKKFFFNMHNFDDEVMDGDLLEDEITKEEEEVEDLPPPPPLFTERELEAAKKLAFNEGHKMGVQDTEAAREATLNDIMQRLSNDVGILFSNEIAREKAYERDVLKLVHAIFERVFPALYERHGFEALTAHLESILQDQQGQKHIAIRIAPDYAQDITAFMDKLLERNPSLNFSVKSDETLQGECFSLDWDDGGAIYDSPALADRILANLDEILASEAVPSHNEKSEESNISTSDTLENPSEDKTSLDEPETPTSHSDLKALGTAKGKDTKGKDHDG